jgi:hypothetical protein
MAKRPPLLPGRIYSAALTLYPAAFRREFAREMTRDFDEAGQEAWLERRWRGLLTVWSQMGVDLARSVVRQWIQTGVPVIMLVSAVTTLAAAGTAAQILVGEPMTPPASADDRDLVMLMLLIATALGVIFGTIVFTVWFTRPLARRPPCSRRVV